MAFDKIDSETGKIIPRPWYKKWQVWVIILVIVAMIKIIVGLVFIK